ncbi:Spherulation-specific family 4 [Usnea florida]
MKYSLHLAPLFFLAVPTTSFSVLLPLYVWVNTPDWNNAIAAIDAYPSVQWQVIINPNSGPGTTMSYPSNPDYLAGIAQMNSKPNVQTLGYVDTGAGTKKSTQAVESEVAVYASWASYTGADIAIRGIYFDDVSNQDDQSVYDYMSAITTYAFTSMPSSDTRVVYNPGTFAPSTLLSYANMTVQYEKPYAEYQSVDPLAQIPAGDLAKTGVQIYSTPTSAYGDVAGLVRTMAEKGLQAVYFGADCCYKTLDATLLMDLAKAVSEL